MGILSMLGKKLAEPNMCTPDMIFPETTEPSSPAAAKILAPLKTQPTLRRGSKGAGVVSLQLMLKQLEYLDAKVDGDFGAKTDAAVRAFQQAEGLVVDGIVGPKTLQMLGVAADKLEVEEVVAEPTEKPFNHIVIDEAQQYVFVREKGGPNKGPEVEMFQKAVDGVASGEPWCMCFVQYVLKKIEKLYNISFRILSSEHCMTVWNKTPKELRLAQPVAGCLGICQHYSYNKEKKVWEATTSGHVFFVKKVNGDHVYTLEGNTNDGGSREGDGVYERLRAAWKKDGSLRTVGYLKLEAVYNEVKVNFT